MINVNVRKHDAKKKDSNSKKNDEKLRKLINSWRTTATYFGLYLKHEIKF